MTDPHADFHAKTAETYLPQLGRVVELRDMTARDRYFRLELARPLGHRPGQFVMASVLGVGEAPISISSGPRPDNLLELVIRNAGRLTRVFHNLRVGDTLGIRGPYGNGFDLPSLYGHDILFVAGGLGLVPLRSLILPVLEQAHRFGRILLVSGCRTPAEELYREEVKAWASAGRLRVLRLVDQTDNLPWDGAVGLVTAPLPTLDFDPQQVVAALCGPPVMYKFVILALTQRKVPHHRIFVDLERRMKCGLGKCGHCQINHVYCCQSGPVFRFSEIASLPEALR